MPYSYSRHVRSVDVWPFDAHADPQAAIRQLRNYRVHRSPYVLPAINIAAAAWADEVDPRTDPARFTPRDAIRRSLDESAKTRTNAIIVTVGCAAWIAVGLFHAIESPTRASAWILLGLTTLNTLSLAASILVRVSNNSYDQLRLRRRWIAMENRVAATRHQQMQSSLVDLSNLTIALTRIENELSGLRESLANPAHQPALRRLWSKLS